jgi:hypothetical protein
MKLKHLFLFAATALICIFKVFGVQTSDPCNETASLIRQVTTAKIKYEEASYFNSKRTSIYKRRYYALVKRFKQKDSIEFRKNCLRQMLRKDSISHIDKIIFFTYLPLVSSTVTPCNEMRYPEFLSTMLMNFDDPNNDSTLVCDPEVLSNRRRSK